MGSTFAVPLERATGEPVGFNRRLLARLVDRRFWPVEGAILAVTVVHGAGEVTGVHQGGIGSHTGLQQVLVLLYLMPVVYASLHFGLEGGVVAGLSSLAVAAPNIVLFHLHDYEWLGELSAIVVVLGVGVAVAVPVEHERREWRRAEASSRRLALINGIARLLAEAPAPEATLEALLDRLLQALGLDGVALTIADPPIFAVRARTPESTALLRAAVGAGGQRHPGGPTVVTFPISADGSPIGTLAVATGKLLGPEDHALLAAVAHHVGLEFESARIHRDERERFRNYARGVVAAQEAERSRIARELHDDLAQTLLHLGRGLGAFRDLDGVPAELVSRAEDLRALSLSTLTLVRDFAHDLRPAALTDLGLAPALARAAAEHGARCGAKVDFSVDGVERRLSPDTEVAAFRIAQEAMRNVEKHAGASHLWVRLQFESDTVRFSVQDDGVGIGAAPADRPGGDTLGIAGMRERAELEGGSVRIGPRAGGGTTVEAVLPASAQ